jgi:transcriptional regulator with GAF, ATPase, and Fis domain
MTTDMENADANSDAQHGTDVIDERPDAIVFRRMRVSVVLGPDQGLTRESDARELSIGTSRGNDVVLTDAAVSRHHCVIESTPQGFRLTDLGSTNGTRLGPYRIERGFLGTAAQISLGASAIKFEALDDLVSEPLSPDDRFGTMLGRSPAMRRLFADLPRIAASDATVLLEGETGTGKGLLCDAIHQASPRRNGPFIVVDCAAIPPTLIESELFGHERGAFTGAHATRVGAFEAAQGGTVFLDELGELPLDMQPKLLRALEERSIKRVGSVTQIPLDVRVVAATSRDLREEVNRGTFRADLFYRMNVVRLRVPPLRERREDIPLYVAHFYEQFVDEGDRRPPPALVAAMSRSAWLGNVRELRAAVERAVLLGDPAWTGDAPATELDTDASLQVDTKQPFRVAKQRAVDQWERAYLAAILRDAGGSLSAAARLARMDRNYLRERVARLGLRAH